MPTHLRAGLLRFLSSFQQRAAASRRWTRLCEWAGAALLVNDGGQLFATSRETPAHDGGRDACGCRASLVCVEVRTHQDLNRDAANDRLPTTSCDFNDLHRYSVRSNAEISVISSSRGAGRDPRNALFPRRLLNAAASLLSAKRDARNAAHD